MEGNNRDKVVADLEKILSEDNDQEGPAFANVRQLLAQLGIAAAKKTGFDRNERLLKGIEHFQTTKYEKNIALFEGLAQTQTPKFLVFACCESHVCPSHVLDLQPGEAVVFRNLANIVPPFDERKLHSDQVAATIEYAVLHQEVESILVVGHSGCEGIKRLMSIADDGTSGSTIDSWVKTCEAAKVKVEAECKDLSFTEQCTRLAKEAINISLGNLMSYPWVAKAVLMKKTLILQGGFYNAMNGYSELWNFGITPSISSVTVHGQTPVIESQHPPSSDRSISIVPSMHEHVDVAFQTPDAESQHPPSRGHTVVPSIEDFASTSRVSFAPGVEESIASVLQSIAGSSTSSPGVWDFQPSMPRQVQHKRCTCKVCTCLQNYCPCFKANVGCSALCSCQSCQNSFGMREGSTPNPVARRNMAGKNILLFLGPVLHMGHGNDSSDESHDTEHS